MELRYLLWLIRKWFWLILLACLIGGAAGLAVSLLQPKLYEAQTTLYLVSPNSNDFNAVSGAQQAAKSFALLPQSGSVLMTTLQTVGDTSLSPSRLSSMITVENNLDSQLVIIRVRDRDPKRAAQLANEITQQSVAQFETATTGSESSKQFVKQQLDRLKIDINNLEKELAAAQSAAGSGVSSTSSTSSINQLNTSLNGKLTLYDQLLSSYESMSSFQVTILQDAQIPKDPVGGGSTVAIAIGLLAGLIVIGAVILFIEQKNDIVRLPPKAGHGTDLPTSIAIKGLLTTKESRSTRSAPVDMNGLDSHGTAQDAKRDLDRLPHDASTLSASQSMPSSSCPRCNGQLAPQSAFCPHCGTYLLSSTPVPAIPTTPAVDLSVNDASLRVHAPITGVSTEQTMRLTPKGKA